MSVIEINVRRRIDVRKIFVLSFDEVSIIENYVRLHIAFRNLLCSTTQGSVRRD